MNPSFKRRRMLVYLEFVIDFIRSLIHWVIRHFFSSSAATIGFDNGIRVVLGRKISEGGFSYIYSATDISPTSMSYRGKRERYAVKRIVCPDDELVLGCRREARIHQTVGDLNAHTLPLLAVKFDMTQSMATCYMLFPLISGGSLRDEITKRNILYDTEANKQFIRPFTEREVLHLFMGILTGTKTIHNAGYAHCDIKLENILLQTIADPQSYDEESASPLASPILIDYGSARSLVIKPTDRRIVMNLVEEAARNSTISYRAPELFEGGCRYGDEEPDIDGRSDVWSCGCVLFAMMFGASPFEMEFKKDGNVRIVDCTYLRILGGNIPLPPKNTEASRRYNNELLELVKWILQEDRVKRPCLEELIHRTEFLYQSVCSNSRQ